MCFGGIVFFARFVARLPGIRSRRLRVSNLLSQTVILFYICIFYGRVCTTFKTRLRFLTEYVVFISTYHRSTGWRVRYRRRSTCLIPHRCWCTRCCTFSCRPVSCSEPPNSCPTGSPSRTCSNRSSTKSTTISSCTTSNDPPSASSCTPAYR